VSELGIRVCQDKMVSAIEIEGFGNGFRRKF